MPTEESVADNETETENAQTAEAEEVASKLPSVPTSEPKSDSGDGEPPEKKQKHVE